MDERTKKIKESILQLTKLIREADIEKDETRKLYRFILKRLPKTIIVDRKLQDNDCFFQGITDLFSDREFYELTLEERGGLSLAFKFLKNWEARISIGYYTGPEIFYGSWPEAVMFILMKFEESAIFPGLNREERDSLARAMHIFKSKTL